MKYIEKFSNIFALFTYNLECNVDTLNAMFIMRFGERDILPQVEKIEVGIIAKMIETTYQNKWDNIKKISMQEITLGVEKEVTTYKKENENSTSASTENIEKTSAFNDDDFTNKDSDSNTNSINENKTEIYKNTREKMDLSPTEYTQVFLVLHKNNFYDTICRDVAETLMFNIYE